MRCKKSARHSVTLLCGILLFSALLTLRPGRLSAQEDTTWKEDWAIENGFSISTDVGGIEYPTSLTFVPNPGSAPKDPLYFITEVRGTIKVVTNDRTIYTFAENFIPPQTSQLPVNINVIGLTGICLDPEHGYIFAVYALPTTHSEYTNHLIRFTSTPITFSAAASTQEVIAPAIETFTAVNGHQIDSCVVLDGALYVTIGEGGKRAGSQDINLPFGKILRMTLDGQPLPDNPHYTDGDATKISNYVWARGLRNPYAIEAIGGRIYVFDNGENTDRLLAITPGENYRWDGTDWSMGANAMTVLSPSLGPAQMDYVTAESSLFPASHSQTLFVASAASESSKVPSIISLPVDFGAEYVTGIPRVFLQYRGEREQYVVGLAVGPDALYFTALLPDTAGENYVFRINYNPENAHPYVVGEDSSTPGLLNLKGCLNCHSLDGVGGSEAPMLDEDVLVPAIQTRLGSNEYRTLVAQLDERDDEPFLGYRAARQQVLAASGMDQVRVWIRYHLLEPKFDNPQAQMPNLGLTEDEAARLTSFLLNEEVRANAFQSFAKGVIPELRYIHVAIFFVLGFGIGAGLALGVLLLQKRRAARKTRREA
jgi:hypothetical protein